MKVLRMVIVCIVFMPLREG